MKDRRAHELVDEYRRNAEEVLLRDQKINTLRTVLILNIGLTAAQLISSYISGSLVLLADAMHNCSDAAAIAISLFAVVAAKLPPTSRKTFGYKRAETLSALANSGLLLLAAVYLAHEAVQMHDMPIERPSIVIWMAMLSIVVNSWCAWLLKVGSKASLNLRSAYCHLFSDMLTSVVVLFGGIAMVVAEVQWIDSFLAAGIAVYLLIVSMQLLKEVVSVLMHFTPSDVSLRRIREFVTDYDTRFSDIHHVHIWTMADDEIHLEAHLELMEDMTVKEVSMRIVELGQRLNDEFNISHVTLQPEFNLEDDRRDLVF